MPKISVIVPVYNVEMYLGKCLDSILNQTLEDIEVIVINDGSKDRSKDIIDEYARKDDRVKPFHKENRGQGYARNSGLQAASGEYITFVDSDDWIEPDMYKEMYQIAKDCGADMVVCNYRDVTENTVGEAVLSMPRNSIEVQRIGLENFVREYFLTYSLGCEVWNKLYRRDMIEKNQIRFERNREIFAEDWLFNLYLYFTLNRIAMVDKAYYNHFIRCDSFMHGPKQNLTKRLMNLIEKYCERASLLGRFDEVKSMIPEMIYSLVNLSIHQTMSAESWGSSQVKKELLDAEAHPLFLPAMRNLVKNKKVKISQRVFAWFCSHHMYTAAVLYKWTVFKVLRMKHKVQGSKTMA